MAELTREQLVAWAAGFFDGEGSIGLTRARAYGKVMTLRVRVGQISREPLERFVLLWGGSIWHRKANERQAAFYEWSKNSRPGYEVLLEMEPYLVVKRAQVQVARDFMSGVGIRGGTRGPGKGNGALSADEMARREGLKEAMHILNKRGPT